MNQSRAQYALMATVVMSIVVSWSSPAMESRPDPKEVVVQIGEEQTDSSPNGSQSSECIIVQSNRHFHLERRRQQLPSPTARVTIFESSLSQQQFQQLTNILQQGNFQNLPAFVQHPVNATRLSVLNVKVRQGSGTRNVGYIAWSRHGSGSPNSVPDDVERAWQDSEIALKPLVNWFHEIPTTGLRPSKGKPNLCGASDETD
jgi:hypothetical protein